MDIERLREIAKKYLEGTSSQEENDELHAYYNHVNGEETESIVSDYATDNELFGQQMLADLQHRIKQNISEKKYTPKPLSKIFFIYWKVAAAMIILSSLVVFYFNSNNKKPVIAYASHDDIQPPVSSRATITLGNGEKIYLDSVTNGIFANQGAVELVKLQDGTFAYQKGTGEPQQVLFNTLFNPFGSRVAAITLSDGTKVWLNAGSSLTYPAAFSGKERKVSIEGEAYFEVAHDPSLPFKVRNGETEVTVLGTHFNVNAYKDEPGIDVTLIEGKVAVSRNNKTQKLSPGQQATIPRNGDILFSASVDIEQVMAWKNGAFSFKGSDIQNIMRQIARWYNVDIEYKGEIKERFYVEMDRNTNVSNVFKILAATGGVHFDIKKNKIIVMP
jgi:transmembrane sensor